MAPITEMAQSCISETHQYVGLKDKPTKAQKKNSIKFQSCFHFV